MRGLTGRSGAETDDSLLFAFFQAWADASPTLGWGFTGDRPYLREDDVTVFDQANGDVWRERITGGSEERVKVEYERVDFGAHG